MAAGRKLRYEVIGDSCSQFFGKQWYKICSGNIPDELEGKTASYLLDTGEPYSTFHLIDNENTVLLIFHDVEVKNCESVIVHDATTITCVHTYTTYQLNFPASRVRCIDQAFTLGDDLIESCEPSSTMTTEFAMLLYAYAEDTEGAGEYHYISKAPNCSLNMMMFLLLALIWLLNIFRLT